MHHRFLPYLSLLFNLAPLLSLAAPPAPTDPCTDFYAFARNASLAADKTVKDQSNPGVFAQLTERSRTQQKALLERAAAQPGDTIERALGTFYAAALDRATLDKLDIAPLRPFLDRLAALKKPRDVAAFLAWSHAQGLPLLFRFDAGADLRQPRQAMVYARQGGLALPDRDYYLREDNESQKLRAQYRAYVARLLTLTGSAANAAAAEAAQVLNLETRLARVSLSVEQLRDPVNSYAPVDVSRLKRSYPHFEWKKFLRTQELRKQKQISLTPTAFFSEVDTLLANLPMPAWRLYLRFQSAHALAPYLSAPFRDARFALFGKALQGLENPPDAATAALTATDETLGFLLGARYAALYLKPETRTAATQLAQGLQARLRDRIEHSAWLSAAARQAGLAKLDAMKLSIAAESPVELDDLALARDQLANNVLAVHRWRRKTAFAALQKPFAPPDPPAQRVALFYDPVFNRLAATAAVLAPPLFDPSGDAIANYGALGVLMAHEMSQGFDVQGSRIDATGNAKAWWSEADYTAFTERTRALADQYDKYKVLGDLHVDGRRTFLANAADLAGLEIAWGAASAAGLGNGKPLDGTTPAQRFFLAWARVWQRDYTDPELRMELLTARHPPAPFRVLGPLANLPAFAGAYACKPGVGFVRKVEERARLWD